MRTSELTLVSYATWRYKPGQNRLAESATQFGIRKQIHYNPSHLHQTDFYRQHKTLLDRVRGGGYWAWKPYFILKAMEQLQTGEMLLYLDAGVAISQPLEPLIEACQMNRGFASFMVHEHLQKHWTKRDCFVLTGCDELKYHQVTQSMSGLLFMAKCPLVLDMLKEWGKYVCDSRIVSDDPNVCGLPNFEGFREHRHDQSILTNLAIQRGFSFFRDPTQYGEPYIGCSPSLPIPGHEDYRCDYPTLFDLHRHRRPSWRTSLKTLVKNPIGFWPIAAGKVKTFFKA